MESADIDAPTFFVMPTKRTLRPTLHRLVHQSLFRAKRKIVMPTLFDPDFDVLNVQDTD